MRPAVIATATSLTLLVATTVIGAPIALAFLFAITTGMSIGSVGAMVRARWTHLITNPANYTPLTPWKQRSTK